MAIQVCHPCSRDFPPGRTAYVTNVALNRRGSEPITTRQRRWRDKNTRWGWTIETSVLIYHNQLRGHGQQWAAIGGAPYWAGGRSILSRVFLYFPFHNPALLVSCTAGSSNDNFQVLTFSLSVCSFLRVTCFSEVKYSPRQPEEAAARMGFQVVGERVLGRYFIPAPNIDI